MVDITQSSDSGLNLTAQPQKSTKKTSESKLNNTFKKLKGVKNIEIIIAVIAVVVMLVIYFSSKITLGSNASTPPATSLGTEENYCSKMERELTQQLSKLKNAGQVNVIVNWESGVESIIAYTTNTSSNSTSSTPQIISSNGSGQPIVLKEIYPKALGVVVICQGGDNVSVKLDIINAVSTLLGITADKIHVLTMSK